MCVYYFLSLGRCWENGSYVGENSEDCLDGGKSIVSQSCKRGRSEIQESLGECAGSSGGGACGAAGWEREIMRDKLDSFGNTFSAVPWNVDVVT